MFLSRKLLWGAVTLALPFTMGCADPEPSKMKDAGEKSGLRADAGSVGEDARVPTARAKPTMIAPVSGGGEVSSGKYKARIIVTAPQPAGQTSSAKHKATLSVTGDKP